MASEIRAFACTVPAGTAEGSPVSFDLSFPPRIVDEIDVIAPTGLNGHVGFRIGSSGEVVIPYNAGEWITPSGEVIAWPLVNQIDSGSWTLWAYNTGTFDHTLQVRFLLAPVAVPPTVAAGPIPADQLAPAVQLSVAGTVPSAGGAAVAGA